MVEQTLSIAGQLVTRHLVTPYNKKESGASIYSNRSSILEKITAPGSSFRHANKAR